MKNIEDFERAFCPLISENDTFWLVLGGFDPIMGRFEWFWLVLGHFWWFCVLVSMMMI